MSEIRIKTLVVGMVGTNCYLVYDNETKRAAVIDPGDGAGQIANMANNKSRGLVDRARNWATDNADMHAARKRSNTASDIERRRNGERINPLRARGLHR